MDSIKPTRPHPNTPIDVALGERFRQVRKRQNLTLHDMKRMLGVSVNTIRWHEAGSRSMRIDMIVRAAACMGVEPSELIPEGILLVQEQKEEA